MRSITLSSMLFALLLSASCGSSESETGTETGTEATSGGEQAAPAAENIPWDDRTPQQKAQFMNEVVVPTMKQVFQQFDGQRFAQFGCANCHGQNAREVHFHMPNTLHPLNVASMPSADSSDPEVARWATFMSQQVLPKMAELIGEPPYDPATNQGFGCFNCHAREQ